MSRQLFKVDLSDAARDFQATATEPGLAMLDRNNANYNSLRRWLGDYVAEPEWLGQDVHFYIRLEDRGRLENVHCVPCTKQDLLGPLQPQLEELDQKLRKARPETANEQLLHRIARKQFADLTRDYDASDFHCYFFKYRAGNDPQPRLVWCWGYQRTDVEPARTLICANPDCEALYEKRPSQKARCPVCASVGTRGRKPPAPLWLRIAQLALLLILLAGFAWFLVANRPRLVATPDHKIVPPGSRVPYNVRYKRWFLFDDDVTAFVVPQSSNQKIVRFEPSGALAKARSQGNAQMKFLYKNMEASATLTVTPPKQPKSISIVVKPAGDVKLGVGTTQQLQLIGKYDPKDKLDEVELTDVTAWSAEKPSVVYIHQAKPGVVEGASEGQSKIVARYRASDKEKWLEASADAFVTEVPFKSIELAVTPKEFGLGQGAKIEAFGISEKDGKKYAVTGSSLLKLSIDPTAAADVDGDYLVGIQKGKAKLNASLLKWKASADFEVTDSLLAAGTFAVSPGEAEVFVDSYLDLDVITAGTEPIEVVSSKPDVVTILSGPKVEPNRRISIAGKSPGTADVTLKQGSNTQTVKVKVIASNIATLHIDPIEMMVDSGASRLFRVYGLTNDGKEIDIAPSLLTWEKQPPPEYARLNRNSLEITGVLPSGGQTFPLVAHLNKDPKIKAESKVRVGTTELALTRTIIDGPDDFLAYPPISAVGGGRVITIDGGPYFSKDELVFQKGRGLVVNDVGEDSIFRSLGVPPGVVISNYGGIDLTGMSLEEIRRIIAQRPPTDGMMFDYIDSAGARIRSKFGVSLVQDVRLTDARSENVSGSNFNAVLTLQLRYPGEYRITTSKGDALTDWAEAGPGLATITTSKIPRTDTDRYELFVEANIDGDVERHQIKFNLTAQMP